VKALVLVLLGLAIVGATTLLALARVLDDDDLDDGGDL
jgi:hypothetical protein